VSIHGATLGALGTASRDGEPAILEIGDWKYNVYWNSARQQWVGEPMTILQTMDQQEMKFNDSLGLFAWHFIAFPYGTARAYGSSLASFPNFKAIYDAGFRYQENIYGFLRPDNTGIGMQVSIWYYEFNQGEATHFTDPPTVTTNSLGIGNVLAGRNFAPSGFPFKFEELGWTDLAIVPTKNFIYPDFYGQMKATATGPGAVLDLVGQLRLVGTP
jgi:hypothetical protein